MSVTIIVKTAKERLEFTPEKDFVTVGRSSTNDVTIEDPSVSRKHAVFEKEGEAFFITDLNSSNGTFVNGKKITERTKISMTDTIIVGRVNFSFIAEQGEEESTMRITKEQMGALRNVGATNEITPPPVTDNTPVPPPPTPQIPVPPVTSASPSEAETHSISDPVNIPLSKHEMPNQQRSVAPPVPPAPSVNTVNKGRMEPAGFWIRLVAYILDAFILGIPLALIITIFSVAAVKFVPAESISGTFFVALFGNLLSIGISFFYMIFFWVKFGATPGKMILKLQVLDASTMDRISYGKAIIRLLGYMLSSIFFIGFILIAFSNKKKGLHDMIAGTVVVKK
jgi:uncharacterized RDD family membrane protein YckC